MSANPLSDLVEFQEKLGVKFNNEDLLRQAFVHRSYLNEHRGFSLDHNERLEFLGDAVLELVVTEYLYNTFPNPEGELTNWRSALVKGETLASISGELGVADMMMLSYGEAKSGGKSKNIILANAFEALLGALYLDQGYDPCKELISRIVLSRLENILQNELFIDPKSRLQEYTQENMGQTPNYQVLSQEGPDHSKEFEVGVYVGSKLLATGKGSSKQAGQIAAAETALRELINTKPSG